MGLSTRHPESTPQTKTALRPLQLLLPSCILFPVLIPEEFAWILTISALLTLASQLSTSQNMKVPGFGEPSFTLVLLNVVWRFCVTAWLRHANNEKSDFFCFLCVLFCACLRLVLFLL